MTDIQDIKLVDMCNMVAQIRGKAEFDDFIIVMQAIVLGTVTVEDNDWVHEVLDRLLGAPANVIIH